MPSSSGVGSNFQRIVSGCRCRDGPVQYGSYSEGFRCLVFAPHGVHIGYGPPCLLCRNLKCIIVIGLQQYALCLHQPLPDSPVGCLTEIAALCVLEMRSSCGKRDFHIRNRRACQNSEMLFLLKVGEDQPLPVEIQLIRTAAAAELQPAAAKSASRSKRSESSFFSTSS